MEWLSHKRPVSEGAELQEDAIQRNAIIDVPGGRLLPLDQRVCRWYALYTFPRHEKRVAEQIEKREISCFLPLYRSVRRWKDRRKELELALFPGYVFVRVAIQDKLEVLKLPGVVRLVTFNGQPAALPDNELESLRRGLAGQVRMMPHPYLHVGRRVRLKSGPMAGLEGILRRRKDGLRLIVSVEILMRAVAVEVDEADVAPF
ncbi:MAG TPA: UpxY family transcription antiterminator [Candidatus Sulfotelmatobacter sp.]